MAWTTYDEPGLAWDAPIPWDGQEQITPPVMTVGGIGPPRKGKKRKVDKKPEPPEPGNSARNKMDDILAAIFEMDED